MLAAYEDYIDLLQKEAEREGLAELRLAREEFHNLTGKFEDGEPWFESRMIMFLDWYLLDRRGRDGLTPVERFLAARGGDLSGKERLQMEQLTLTLRSVFEILEVRDGALRLHDLALGGHWSVESPMPTVGLATGDILDARIALFNGAPNLLRGMVLHPKEASETIREIVARARAESMEPRTLVDHLDQMRLKLDRYSNVRIPHVYRYPGHAAS